MYAAVILMGKNAHTVKRNTETLLVTFFLNRFSVHLDIIEVFHSPTDALFIILENSKIYIKIYIKIAATCFGPRPSSGSLQLSLVKLHLC
jgi:hypothetical protein